MFGGGPRQRVGLKQTGPNYNNTFVFDRERARTDLAFCVRVIGMTKAGGGALGVCAVDVVVERTNTTSCFELVSSGLGWWKECTRNREREEQGHTYLPFREAFFCSSPVEWEIQ